LLCLSSCVAHRVRHSVPTRRSSDLLQCFGASDLPGILSDYTAGAVLFTPTGVLTGPGEMRTLFMTMFAEFAKPGTTFDLVRKDRSEEHTSELQSRVDLVCRLLLEKK